MLVFLTSSPSGPLDGSRQVDGLDHKNQFVENLKKFWKPNEMIQFFQNASAKAGLTSSAFDLWDARTKEFSKEELCSYDVVWLGGGHVPTQNRFFTEIELREKIQEFNGIVIGISAGTMNSADVVYAQPEHPGESIDPEYERYLMGLNLTKKQILPHYQMVKDYELDGRRLYEDITYEDSFGKRFLVLPDGSYLMSQNGDETVWGEAYEIADGKLCKICEDEEGKGCSLLWE